MDLQNKIDIFAMSLSFYFNPILKEYEFSQIIGSYWHKDTIQRKYINKKTIENLLKKYMEEYAECLCTYLEEEKSNK